MAPNVGGAPMAAGPSEFTRVLGRVPPPAGPVMPPAPTLPPGRQPQAAAPTPVIAPQPVAEQRPRPKSYLPLIIALNVVLIGAIVAVVYFVMKK